MLPTRTRYRTVAITGASRGLGAALAIAYAGPECRVVLGARDEAALTGVAEQCRQAGGDAVVRPLDVSEPASVADWVTWADDQGPVDLLIVNAGIFEGRRPSAAIEEAPIAIPVVETNLTGAILCAGTMAGLMVKRTRGQIALVSSLAADLPSADAMAYSASKAGLSAYGVALREAMAPYGVDVSVLRPGHIETAQTRAHVGPLPFLISADRAASIVRRRLDRGAGYLAFPTGAWAVVRLANLLPWRLRAWLGKSARFAVQAPEDQAQPEGHSPWAARANSSKSASTSFIGPSGIRR